MSKICVTGSLNMDMVIVTPRIPVLGETILGRDFFTTPGGKGANQAVSAARLGGQVCMVGCVGNDFFGKELIKNLADNNVNVENIEIMDEAASGVAMIVVKDGNNFIIVDPGANSMLSCEMIDKIEPVIKEQSVLAVQLEIPMEAVERAMRIAKKHNVTVLLDPAPAKKLTDEFLSFADIIVPNESECELITGLPVKNIEQAKAAAEHLMNRGIPQVIITLGNKGVVYNSGTKILHKPVPQVEVVDTTAAGDCFAGALAVAISKGKSIDESVDFANIAATLSVMKRGAQSSLPYIEDIENGKSKLTI